MSTTRLCSKNAQAWVSSGGKDLEIYGVQVDDAKKETICYISSEVGQAFTVSWRKLTRDIACRATLWLDGFSANTIINARSITCVFSQIQTSKDTAREFIFSPLELTDDDLYLDPSGANQEIGEIKIEIDAVQVLSEGEGAWDVVGDPPAAEKVHERSKKALAHRITFGEEKKWEAGFGLTCEVKDLGLLRTFIFRYRPLAVLQANNVAPRNLALPEALKESSCAPRLAPGRQPIQKRKASLAVKEESNDDLPDGSAGNSRKRPKTEPREQLGGITERWTTPKEESKTQSKRE